MQGIVLKQGHIIRISVWQTIWKKCRGTAEMTFIFFCSLLSLSNQFKIINWRKEEQVSADGYGFSIC
ncbi:Uncharacterized protein dnm_094570 [Desulfonema magnum]|uniref:Uncharacterized protein n=1 Tax=Desulfonema magnum TaxID=45655 RepID=A0A975GTS0_9BACT|nr:Uncharacterized protein dnm_094570 [Desulfonema magnum]